MNLWKSDLVLRYCDGLHHRKGYGSLYIFAKPVNTPSLLNEYLKFSILFYNIGLNGFEANGSSHYIEQYTMSKETLSNYFNHLEKFCANNFGDFPYDLVKTGVEASINKQKLKYETDANNRSDILRIFLLMAKFQQKNAAANNKRAESPEKSLLSLFQKDFQFLGVDKNFLYELEMIARENRW